MRYVNIHVDFVERVRITISTVKGERPSNMSWILLRSFI